ncbi:MAG: hypothetical protein WBC22_09875, partial [Sedimentisphaerales bacterium]
SNRAPANISTDLIRLPCEIAQRYLTGLKSVVKFFQKSSIFIEHSKGVWYNYNRHRNGRISGDPQE